MGLRDREEETGEGFPPRLSHGDNQLEFSLYGHQPSARARVPLISSLDIFTTRWTKRVVKNLMSRSPLLLSASVTETAFCFLTPASFLGVAPR